MERDQEADVRIEGKSKRWQGKIEKSTRKIENFGVVL